MATSTYPPKFLDKRLRRKNSKVQKLGRVLIVKILLGVLNKTLFL